MHNRPTSAGIDFAVVAMKSVAEEEDYKEKDDDKEEDDDKEKDDNKKEDDDKALLNTRGQLIGMNTAIMSSSGDSSGVGFAIPVSTIARIAPQLIREGRVVRASIGIKRVYENDDGLLIVDTVEGGPADLAGLRGFQIVTKTYRQGPYQYPLTVLDTSKADLILAVDGQPVKTADALLEMIEQKNPGDVVVLTIQRERQRTNVSVTLGRS